MRAVTVDIEGDLIGWLPGEMQALGWTVAVADQLTKGESIAVYRTGGPMRDMVTDSPTIQIDCRGRTKERSAKMAADLRERIHYLQGREVNGHAVQRVQEFAGPVADPIDDAPTRYTQVFSLDVSVDIV